MIDFAKVQGVEIPEGKAIKITSGGLSLWESLQKVESIKGNGLAYIDTGIVPDNDTRVDALVSFLPETVGNSAIMGASDSDGVAFDLSYDGNNESFRTSYGSQKSSLWTFVSGKVRISKNKENVTVGSGKTTFIPEEFTVKDTIKLFANSKQPRYGYRWYVNGKLIEYSNDNNYIGFLGNKEEEATYWCEVINDGKVTKSNECTVFVNDNSLLSGATYTHNATIDDWYFNNNPTGIPNEYDYNGEFLTDGNIFNDFWQDKYFGVKKINPVIEFDLEKPITFKELQIFVVEGTAGIHAPKKVTIEYMPVDGEEWVAIYDDKCYDNDLILVSPVELTAKALRFSFITNENFCLIDEIRAFASYSGLVPDGVLEEVKPNVNILLGLPYTHNVTKWYQGTPRDNGTALTDGVVAGSFYGDNYLNAQQKMVTVSFDFDEVKEITEIYIKAFRDSNADVTLPMVTVSIEDDNGNYRHLYDGFITQENFRLSSDDVLKAKKLVFDFSANQRYVFIKEIQAYQRATGEEINGVLADVQVSMIRGMMPDSISILPTDFAFETAKDMALLTDGIIYDDNTTYKKNVTFKDNAVDFVYALNKPFKAVRVHSNFPTDLSNSDGIDNIVLRGLKDGKWTTISTITDPENDGTYEYITGVAKDYEKLLVRINRKSSGWISLGEIEVLEEAPEKAMMFASKPPSKNVVAEEVETFGNTPVIVKNIPHEKTVNVGEKFTLSVVATSSDEQISDIARIKMDSCQIWQKDVLVRDYVAKVNGKGVAGFYDNVTKRFFTSNGISDFDYE